MLDVILSSFTARQFIWALRDTGHYKRHLYGKSLLQILTAELVGINIKSWAKAPTATPVLINPGINIPCNTNTNVQSDLQMGFSLDFKICRHFLFALYYYSTQFAQNYCRCKMRDQGIAKEIKESSVTVNLLPTYKCTK